MGVTFPTPPLPHPPGPHGNGSGVRAPPPPRPLAGGPEPHGSGGFPSAGGPRVARDANFEQVIAVDAHYDLFTRAWCVSELAMAFGMGMKQNLKLLSVRSLHDHKETLQDLKIERMEASRPEDIVEILAAIPDKALFNAKLQSMIFQSIIPSWNNIDALEQAVSIGRVARWQRLSVFCRDLCVSGSA